jgi:hypothetical protein
MGFETDSGRRFRPLIPVGSGFSRIDSLSPRFCARTPGVVQREDRQGYFCSSTSSSSCSAASSLRAE